MIIEYRKKFAGYFVTFHGSLLACDKDRQVALNKAFGRIVFRKF